MRDRLPRSRLLLRTASFLLTVPGLLMLSGVVCAGGLGVESVVPGSAAATAGVRAGDRLVSLGGKPVPDMEALKAVAAGHAPGDTVALVVRRDGEPVELSLTFDERPGGGVSMGVGLAYSPDPGEADEATETCLGWLEERYGITTKAKELGLDLAGEFASYRECVTHDTRRMPASMAVKACDSIFKVHCNGLELLTQVGERVVQRCERWLGEALGAEATQAKSWTTCGQHKVFDRYAAGEGFADAEACRAALKECG